MAIILLVIAIITAATLGSRFGTDSRDLVNGRPDSFPALPDRGDDWVPPRAG